MKPDTLPEACREHRDRLLNKGDDTAAGAAHADSCPACSAWRAMHDALLRAAAAQRSLDVSEPAIRATRRRVAELLAARARKTAGAPAHAFPWRWASAWSAAAALLVALGVSVFNRPPPDGPAPGAVPDSPMAGADLDRLESQIDGLQERIGDRMAMVQSGAGLKSSRPVFDARSTQVKYRIDRCAVMIRRELVSTAPISERKDI